MILPLIGAAEEAPTLRFRPDGTFKVSQFTDLHLDPGSVHTPETLETMRSLIRTEQPDLVILTGDVVTERPAADGWRMITDLMAAERQPYAVVMGNHDPEVLSRDSIFDLLEGRPYCVSERGPKALHGMGNQQLRILSSESEETAALLYLLDSGNLYSDPFVSMYDIIHFDQIAWLREAHAEAIKAAGDRIVPSLLFFHIPIPEYAVLREDSHTLGTIGEGSSSPGLNSGLFSTMLELPGMMGAFCGHDHDNDAIGLLHGLALGYGRVTGRDAYGELQSGGRTILLREGETSFDSWIATPKGGREGTFYYPSGFSSIQEEQAEYLPALPMAKRPTEQGVCYRYYTGMIKSTAEITSATPTGEGTMHYPSIDGATQEDHFGYIFEALLEIPERGLYRFYTYSDDGTVLYIDGTKVVDNDGGHSRRLREGEVALEAGLHRLRIDYFEDYMGNLLEVGFTSKHTARQKLPASLLYLPPTHD